jgi:uncharacterized protein (DUF2141 family)
MNSVSAILVSTLILLTGAAQAGSIELTVTGLRSGDGSLGISLFKKSQSKSFPGDSTAAEQRFYLPLNGQKNLVLEIADIEETSYAISVMHDENNNGALDTNAVGIPKEGFGFSNNPRVTMGAPKFDKCEFTVGADEAQINIKLQYML